MQLPVISFVPLVQRMSAAVTGACSTLLDLTVGSVVLAVIEATAGTMLWLQWLALLVLSVTRAATSRGPDLDSFVGDFGLTRLPGTAASGSVNLSRASTQNQALIVPGVTVRTADLSQTFAVVADATNPTWSAAQGGYVLPAGQTSIAVLVQAATAGSGGNVQAGAITLLGTAVSGVDTPSNALAFTNGLDAEPDLALRPRFQGYINSRSRATVLAVENAIAGVQQGLTSSVQENVDEQGRPSVGHFVVVVDDGTGTPSAGLIATVFAAVDAVRPIGSTFSVVAPVDLLVNINMILTVLPTVSKAALIPQIVTALTAYIDSVSVGQPLPYSRLASLAYAASPLVSNVSDVLLNGGTVDVGGGPTQVVRPGVLTVS